MLKIGSVVGLLTLVKDLGTVSKVNRTRQGLFRCKCGNEVIRDVHAVQRKTVNPSSCGCAFTKRNQTQSHSGAVAMSNWWLKLKPRSTY